MNFKDVITNKPLLALLAASIMLGLNLININTVQQKMNAVVPFINTVCQNTCQNNQAGNYSNGYAVDKGQFYCGCKLNNHITRISAGYANTTTNNLFKNDENKYNFTI